MSGSQQFNNNNSSNTQGAAKKSFGQERQLNLAELMKTSSIYKTAANSTLKPNNLTNNAQEYIKGTQFTKDFQLIAEPLQPKINNQSLSSTLQQLNGNTVSNYQGNGNGTGLPQSAQKNSIKNNNQNTPFHNHPGSATSTVQDQQSVLSPGVGSTNIGCSNIAMSNRQGGDSYYSNMGNGKSITDFQNQPSLNNQQQQQQQYQSNRSVAAKAGQMQIFSNEMQNKFMNGQLNTTKHISQPSSQMIGSSNQAARKFISPPGSHYGKFIQQNQQHHQQQNENGNFSVDFQPMKLKNNTVQMQNPKYIDYINRFQVDSQDYPSGANRPSLGKTLENNHDNFGPSSYSLSAPDDPFSQEGNGQTLQTTTDVTGVTIKQITNNNHLYGPQKKAGTSTALTNLNISGEQITLDQKTSLTRKVTQGGPNIGIANDALRNDSLSQKRQDFGGVSGLHARGYGAKLNRFSGNNNINTEDGIQEQGETKNWYDYVFVQISQETYERDLFDKLISTKGGSNMNNILSNSPSQKSMKDSRILSSLTNSTSKKHSLPGQQTSNITLQQSQQQLSRYKGVRGSTDLGIGMSGGGLLSPMGGQSTINFDDMLGDLLSHQNTNASIFTLQPTQYDYVKVIQNPSYEDADSNQGILEYVKDIIKCLQVKSKRVKITNKKKYIYEAFQGRKMGQLYVAVVGCNLNINPQTQAIIKNGDSSDSSLSEFNFPLNGGGTTKQKNQNNGSFKKNELKRIHHPTASTSGKAKDIKPVRMRNNSTINSKNGNGNDYESENESKSMNSTTASSTTMQFQTRNTLNNNDSVSNYNNPGGLNTNKGSARSMSQKGNGSQPRRLQQKAQSMEESQMMSGQLLQIQQQQQQNQNSNFAKYGPTKIKILQNWEDYAHHQDHRINLCLNNYNTMLQLCFRSKGKFNVPAIMALAKQMSLGSFFNKSWFQGDGGIKGGREQANLIKEKLVWYLCKIMQEENQPTQGEYMNGCEEQITQPQQQYKCFVGKGNNSILIRTLFKTRHWWLLHDKEEIEKVNFMWTQLRKNAIMDQLPCKYEDKKSNLRVNGANGASSGLSSTSTLMQTPTMSSGKMKKKRKNQLQSSTQSLESSGDKKDLQLLQQSSQNQDKQGNSKDSQQQQQQQQQNNQIQVKLYNKLEDNFHLSNKKAMFLNMRIYYEAMGKDVFSAVPVTFHIKEGLEDPEFARFKAYYNKEEEEVKKQKQNKQEKVESATEERGVKKNIWIIKPGENTNRGHGIMVSKEYEEIKSIIVESTANKKRTCIVQKYIHNPLLINKRKFDIRLYAFMSSINGNLKGYFYQDGYLRTSCREFTLQNLSNRMIHLTNDAVQKKAEDYGKFEAGNKLSYNDFQNYLDKNFSDLNICFDRDLLPQMKKLVTDTFRAVYGKLDPKRRIHTFEVILTLQFFYQIYGFDFMFDDDFKVFLIEVNTNPCLELGCPLLARLIPGMVENSLRLVVDPLYPPPDNWSQKKCVVNDICPDNKFELIFDDRIDGPYLTELMKEKNNIIIEIDEEELSDCDEGEEGDN